MRSRFVLFPVPALAIVALAAGCSDEPAPVASVAVEPARLQLSYPGFAEYTLEWSVEAPLAGRQGDLHAFVHLLDSRGVLERTFDHSVSFAWETGATSTYRQKIFQSVLAPPLELGTYDLTIGLYDSAGNRWPLATAGEEVRSLEYGIATVEVIEAGPGYPAFYFSPEWLPVEGGTDRQILGRRWLRENGVIRVGELTRPGTLWLLAGIPSPIEGKQELVLAEGAAEPVATFRADCAGQSTSVAGSGSHEVTIAIGPDEAGELPRECEIAIETNYHLVSVEDRARRTVALESLSWQPS